MDATRQSKRRIMRARHKQARSSRQGFTLLELVLSLALIVVALSLIGGLIQIFTTNINRRGDDIRRAQLARSILTMIADDIRGVVQEQEYDSSVLEGMLGGSGGGGEGAPSGAESGADGLASSSAPVEEDPSSSESDMGSEDLADTASTALPPGIYGSQTELMVDVSRIPRIDEYIPLQQNLMDNSLIDVPGDMKTVTYYVQPDGVLGVQDDLVQFKTQGQDSSMAGLVRRQLDRTVIQHAEEIGDTQRLLGTGDLIAPEVISLEFAYFDGMEWTQEWDSQEQGLPWLVEVTLAMQSESGAANGKLAAGTSLMMLSAQDRQAYGVEMYQVIVAIPGAQLQAADAGTADQAGGMEAMGL